MKNTDYKQKISQTITIISPELADTANMVMPLHLFYKNMMQEVVKILEDKYELSKSELELLVTLATTKDNTGTLAPTKLYESLVFSSGGMTKLLKKLEEKNYINRLDNPKDKRSKLVRITPVAKEITKLAINDVMLLESRYFACLTDDEKSNLFAVLEKLALNLKG